MAAEIYRCANCSFEAEREGLPDAKDLFLRLEAGGIFTDKECPKCGALAFPVKEKAESAKDKSFFWIVLYQHRHGTDAFPIFQKDYPTHEEMIATLDDFEPDREETVEAIGPFEVKGHNSPPPKVLIWMEGGLIQDIGASQEVEVVVIDEDTEGGDEENIRTLKLFGDENKETDFYINDWGKVEATPEFVDHYINQLMKEEPEEAAACTLEEADPK